MKASPIHHASGESVIILMFAGFSVWVAYSFLMWSGRLRSVDGLQLHYIVADAMARARSLSVLLGQ